MILFMLFVSFFPHFRNSSLVVPSCSPEVAPVLSEQVASQNWAHGVSSDTAQARRQGDASEVQHGKY